MTDDGTRPEPAGRGAGARTGAGAERTDGAAVADPEARRAPGREPAPETEQPAGAAGSETEQPADAGAPGVRAARMSARAKARPAKRSRRFPVLTRDTARPEGGARPMGADHAAPYRQWPLLAVSGGVLLGLLLTLLDIHTSWLVVDFRAGCLVIGASLLAGAGMRWWLPSVGMLAVRSRFTDTVTYGVLGLVIALLAMMAQPSPWFTIPFLREILHFSVK